MTAATGARAHRRPRPARADLARAGPGCGRIASRTCPSDRARDSPRRRHAPRSEGLSQNPDQQQPCIQATIPAGGVMRRMQAAGVDAFGGQVHTLELEAPGPPAPDEVLISVHAAGVANWDEFVRTGDWDVGREPPLALGVEA